MHCSERDRELSEMLGRERWHASLVPSFGFHLGPHILLTHGSEDAIPGLHRRHWRKFSMEMLHDVCQDDHSALSQLAFHILTVAEQVPWRLGWGSLQLRTDLRKVRPRITDAKSSDSNQWQLYLSNEMDSSLLTVSKNCIKAVCNDRELGSWNTL